MPTSTILRFCLCSVLSLCLVISVSAQRYGRKRVASVKQETINGVSDLSVSVTSKDLIKAGVISEESDENSNDKTGAPECRETKQVNISGKADSYPYISEDGLRLYFTSNREGGHGRFFISTRKNLAESFGEPKVLSKHLTDGYYAGTLTADELTMVMVMSGDMYISVRKNLNEEFPKPVKISGTGDKYHFGPSISPDGKQIIVTVTTGEKDKPWVYERTGTYSVGTSKILPDVPVGEAGPGQFSKDGLYYYLSIETNKTEHLWRYSRTSLTGDFSNLEELPEQMKGLRCILQPSLNKDGSVLVFVTAQNNLWDDDEILLVNSVKRNLELPKPPADVFASINENILAPEKINAPEIRDYAGVIVNEEEISAAAQSSASVQTNNAAKNVKPVSLVSLTQAKVYPNPFVTYLRVEISNLPETGALFTLYDISGKQMKTERITSSLTNLSLDNLLPGVYSFNITDRKGHIISTGKLVKAE